MLNKAIKMGTKIVNAAIGMVGVAFIAGVVAGAIVSTDAKDVYFSVGNKTVLDSNKDEEKTTEEVEE